MYLDLKNWKKEITEHWVLALAVGFIVAMSFWGLTKWFYINPKENEISQLKHEISELNEKIQKLENELASRSLCVNPVKLEETSVFYGRAVTTTDGRCMVRVISVKDNEVTLAVTFDSIGPEIFEGKKSGDRIKIDAMDQYYYIDIHGVRGSIVDIKICGFKK